MFQVGVASVTVGSSARSCLPPCLPCRRRPLVSTEQMLGDVSGVREDGEAILSVRWIDFVDAVAERIVSGCAAKNNKRLQRVDFLPRLRRTPRIDERLHVARLDLQALRERSSVSSFCAPSAPATMPCSSFIAALSRLWRTTRVPAEGGPGVCSQ